MKVLESLILSRPEARSIADAIESLEKSGFKANLRLFSRDPSQIISVFEDAKGKVYLNFTDHKLQILDHLEEHNSLSAFKVAYNI